MENVELQQFIRAQVYEILAELLPDEISMGRCVVEGTRLGVKEHLDEASLKNRHDALRKTVASMHDANAAIAKPPLKPLIKTFAEKPDAFYSDDFIRTTPPPPPPSRHEMQMKKAAEGAKPSPGRLFAITDITVHNEDTTQAYLLIELGDIHIPKTPGRCDQIKLKFRRPPSGDETQWNELLADFSKRIGVPDWDDTDELIGKSIILNQKYCKSGTFSGLTTIKNILNI